MLLSFAVNVLLNFNTLRVSWIEYPCQIECHCKLLWAQGLSAVSKLL